MVDPTTTNKIYAIPTHGTDVDTWDAPLNSNFSILDKNFGGVLTKSLTNVNVTLTASEQQNGIIRFTGTLTGNVVITFSQLGAYFMIDNRTVGAFYVQLTTAAGGAESIAVPQGEATYVMVDGTNVKFVGLDRPGTYWDYAGSAVPAWVGACTVPPYLICDGTTYSAVTYPHLNAILGTTTLPDLRGRVRAYLNGGTSRITTAGSGIDGDTRLSAGGAQSITLAQANLPNVTLTGTTDSGGVDHTHGYLDNHTSFSGGGSNGFQVGGADFARTTDAASAYLHTHTFTTSSINGNTTQTVVNKMPPATIGGITMIRAA